MLDSLRETTGKNAKTMKLLNQAMKEGGIAEFSHALSGAKLTAEE